MKKQKNNLDEAINALKNESIPPGPSQQTIDVTLQKLSETKLGTIKSRIKITERIKAMKPFTKLAAAAAIIAIATLSITFLDKSVTPAYALEQTIEASHSVRYLHIKDFKANENEPKELWAEFYEDGQVKNVRMHIPEWDSPDDGAKVVVWKENKAQVWVKKKNVLATIKDKSVAAHMLKFIEELDPRLAVEHLREREEQGKVKLEIEEPSDKAEPIVVTATYLPGNSTPSRRFVLFIDQATKLVIAMETYQLKDGEYEYLGLMEYYDYNQPIKAETFTLEQVPDDVIRIDQVTQQVGLAQGALTDEEIAAEVIRQFLEALIERDYAEAGRLFAGVTAERMEKAYGQIRFIRIISIGKPVPHSVTGGLYVPCTVEIEENGEISQWQPEHSYVRQVHGQPDRWEIIGGFRGI